MRVILSSCAALLFLPSSTDAAGDVAVHFQSTNPNIQLGLFWTGIHHGTSDISASAVHVGNDGDTFLQAIQPLEAVTYDAYYKHMFVLRSSDFQFRVKVDVHRAEGVNHNGVHYPYEIFFNNLMLETSPRRSFVVKYGENHTERDVVWPGERKSFHTMQLNEFELFDMNEDPRVKIVLHQVHRPPPPEQYGHQWEQSLPQARRDELEKQETQIREEFEKDFTPGPDDKMPDEDEDAHLERYERMGARIKSIRRELADTWEYQDMEEWASTLTGDNKQKLMAKEDEVRNSYKQMEEDHKQRQMTDNLGQDAPFPISTERAMKRAITDERRRMQSEIEMEEMMAKMEHDEMMDPEALANKVGEEIPLPEEPMPPPMQ